MTSDEGPYRVNDLRPEDRPHGVVWVGERVWQGLEERIAEGKPEHLLAGVDVRMTKSLQPGWAFWFAADGRPIAVQVLPDLVECPGDPP